MSLTALKKGDTVILHMFTGIAVGVKEVLAADKTTVTLETRAGRAKFSRKTGKQIEPKAKSERFANYITEDDGSYQPASKPANKKKAKKADDKKAAKKSKAKSVEAEDEDEDDDDDDEPAPAPKKTKKGKPEKAAKGKSKKAKKSEPDDEDEDFDEDEYEEEE